MGSNRLYSESVWSRHYDTKDDEGPFVFGHDGPHQFITRNHIVDRSNNYVSYDVYDRVPITESESDNLYCDRNKAYIKPASSTLVGTSTPSNMYKNIDRNQFKVKDKSKNAIKCVLMGDDAVGKTSLITSYAQNLFQHEYKPTAIDNYKVSVQVDGRPVDIEICDTTGQDSLEGLRKLCYPGTDVVMLCFSVVKPESFRSIINKWKSAVASLHAPLILVGTQCDLRDNYRIINDLKLLGENIVTEEEAKALAKSLKAPYIETSSKSRNRLKDAFDAAIMAALPKYKKKKKPWWKKFLCPFYKSR